MKYLLASILALAFVSSAYSDEGKIELGKVEVVSAHGADADHRPVRPTGIFPDGTRAIFFVFQSKAGGRGSHRIDLDLYAVDERRMISKDGWVSLPEGQRHSIKFPTDNLVPGRYRLMLHSSAGTKELNFSIEGRAPAAIDLAAAGALTKGLSDTPWADQPGYKDWTRPKIAPNIARAALGARVQAPDRESTGWTKDLLIDGFGWVMSPTDSSKCARCGWATRDRMPVTIDLALPRDKAAEIAAVVLNTDVYNWARNNGYTSLFPKYVTISTLNGAGAETEVKALIPRRPGRFLVPMPVGTRGAKLRIRIDENYGGDGAVLAEIEVLERANNGSVLEGIEFDLAQAALGGTLVSFTGYAEPTLSTLFDGNTKGQWRSRDAYFPQDFTLAFADNRVARVREVRLIFPNDTDPSTWPSEVVIAASTDHPLDGFVEVTQHALPKKPGTHVLPLGVDARFLKIRIIDNHGSRYTSLASIQVIEESGGEYVPMLLRPQEDESEDTDDGAATVSQPDEKEPNDTPETARAIRWDETSLGSINPLGEEDYLRLPPLPSGAKSLTIDFAGKPNIRHSLALLDPEGNRIGGFDPGDVPTSAAQLSFALQWKETFLHVTEPTSSVALVFDTSGSMFGQEKDLEAAVRAYVRAAPADQEIQLIRFGGSVDVLLPGFTSDKAAIQQALGTIKPDGSTKLYDALEKAKQLLSDRRGNRAIIVMGDGEDTASDLWHGDFWAKLEEKRIRFYAIGLGLGMERYSPRFATTGRMLLEHLALATDGQSFHAAESKDLEAFYERIAHDLSAPSIYSVTPRIEIGSGELSVVATAEHLPNSIMPAIHILLDVSGSMSERMEDGSSRMDVAKAAMFTLLNKGLAEGTPFALTVFGSRVPERPDKEKACTDIVTEQTLAPLDSERVRTFIDRLQPRGGTTPLARGIAHVVENFDFKAGGILLVVTDGIEECDDEPIVSILKLFGAGLEELRLNVVGFDLKDEASKGFLRKVAEIGSGQYYDAADREAIAQALRQATAARYAVLDSNGTVVAEGGIDAGPIVLAPGNYEVRIEAANGHLQQRNVRVTEDARTVMEVNKVGEKVGITVREPRLLADIRREAEACGAKAPTLEAAGRVKRVQEKLNTLGFDVGTADGSAGPRTRAGISDFRLRHGVIAKSGIDELLEQHLDCIIATGQPYRP